MRELDPFQKTSLLSGVLVCRNTLMARLVKYIISQKTLAQIAKIVIIKYQEVVCGVFVERLRWRLKQLKRCSNLRRYELEKLNEVNLFTP